MARTLYWYGTSRPSHLRYRARENVCGSDRHARPDAAAPATGSVGRACAAALPNSRRDGPSVGQVESAARRGFIPGLAHRATSHYRFQQGRRCRLPALLTCIRSAFFFP
jgi:hypothetical protein